jgi:uncharacterized integral membrane protein
MKIVKGIVWICLFVLAVILTVENIEPLSTYIVFRADLIFFKGESSGIPIYVIIVFTFVLGVIAMGIFSWVDRYKIQRDIAAIKRAVKEKDKELNSLRNLPITSNDLPGYKEEVK